MSVATEPATRLRDTALAAPRPDTPGDVHEALEELNGRNGVLHLRLLRALDTYSPSTT